MRVSQTSGGSNGNKIKGEYRKIPIVVIASEGVKRVLCTRFGTIPGESVAVGAGRFFGTKFGG
jgi:hypothetical protein